MDRYGSRPNVPGFFLHWHVGLVTPASLRSWQKQKGALVVEINAEENFDGLG